MSTLGEHFTESGSDTSVELSTSTGIKYRVVRLSAFTAGVVVDGVDQLSFTVFTGGDRAAGPGVGVVAVVKETLDSIIHMGVGFCREVAQVVTGQCHTQNVQQATFDPQTGNMTSFTNTVTVVCPG